MADPNFVVCTLNTWVQVAEGITSGKLWIVDTSPDNYLYTYRDQAVGSPAPTDPAEGTPISQRGEDAFVLSFAALSDVYIYAIGAAGRVRVDIA